MYSIIIIIIYEQTESNVMLDAFHQCEVRLGPVAQQQLSDTS